MLNYEELIKTAIECGFTNAGPLDVKTLDFMPEVRDMCSSDKCNQYGKSWSCPPACGTLDDMKERVSGYSAGLLVQTVGRLEDSLDWEAIQETAKAQSENFERLRERLEKDYPNMFAMGTGTCTRCGSCTYPDAPCRFPNSLTSSMEACGLLVSKVCTDNNMPYNYGPNKIAYSACFLLE